ncbi:MAG TPA: DUF6582 domain-containing protein [Rhodanobacter sp.]
MQIFARITKVDEATGKVYGRAVQEVVDRSGEIFDYETSKPLFAKWSEAAASATDGKSVGNLRAMHGKVAAGKLTDITFLDAEKAIDIVAEVVDPVEREKCLKGVYTGFSIGGRYAKKWDDGVQKGVSRYTAEPSEISLVDLPCVPTAQFTVVKADGIEELRKFETTTDNAEALAKWAEGLTDEQRDVLAKIAKRPDVDAKEGEDKYGKVRYADPKNKKYPLDTEKHIRAAWSYIHMPKNSAKYDADDLKTIKAAIVEEWKKVIGGEPDEAEKVLAAQAERLAKNANAAPIAAAIATLIGFEPQLEKGLWAVSQFACLLEQLACMADGVDWEEEYEGDDSTLPAQMRAALKPLAQAFLAMAEEEVDEALHGQLNDAAALELAAQNGGLAKRGAKHSAATKAHFDGMREAHKKMGEHLDALQAEPDGDDDADDGDAEKLAKAADDLQKMTAERDDALAKLAEFSKQYAHWLTQPAAPKGAAKVVAVEKTLSTEPAPAAPDDSPVLKADGTVDHQATAQKLMKVAYRTPMTAR